MGQGQGQGGRVARKREREREAGREARVRVCAWTSSTGEAPLLLDLEDGRAAQNAAPQPPTAACMAERGE
jgi:hypothetical protein